MHPFFKTLLVPACVVCVMFTGGCSNGPYGGTVSIVNNMTGLVAAQLVIPNQLVDNEIRIRTGDTVMVGLKPIYYDRCAPTQVDAIIKMYDEDGKYIGFASHSVRLPVYPTIDITNYNDSLAPQTWIIGPDCFTPVDHSPNSGSLGGGWNSGSGCGNIRLR